MHEHESQQESKCCGGGGCQSQAAEAQTGCCSSADQPARRSFLGAAVAFFAVVWTGLIAGIPLFKYLAPSTQAAVKIDKLVLGKDAEFPAGSSKNFKFGSIPALFIRKSATEMYAYNATCTHLGCTVQYENDKSRIFCACHGGTYDPASGKNISGPPPKPLTALKVALENGEIVVRPA